MTEPPPPRRVLPVGKRGHLKGLQQVGWSQGSKDRAGLSVPLNYSNLTGTHRRSTLRLLSPVWDGVWAADGSQNLGSLPTSERALALGEHTLAVAFLCWLQVPGR